MREASSKKPGRKCHERRSVLKLAAGGLTGGAVGVRRTATRTAEWEHRSGLGPLGSRETPTDSTDWETLSLDEQLEMVREATQPYKQATALRDAGYTSVALPYSPSNGDHLAASASVAEGGPPTA